MKAQLALVAVLLAGCASAPTQYISVDTVLANPGQFNGQTIRVCGWFLVDMETCTLAPTVGSAGFQDDESTIWVVPRSDVCMPANWLNEPHGRWAVVDGTFFTGKHYGHLGLFKHALGGGKIRPIRSECQPAGSAPNNSFKPKPLRGSA